MEKKGAMVKIIYEKDKKKALTKAVEELFIKKGSRVAIKPNVSIDKKEACTDFELLTHLVEYIQEFSPKNIVIVESDTYLRSIWNAYDALDYQTLNVQLINLSEELCTTVWPENTLFFRAFSYPLLLRDIDCVISFAKLKTHILTVYTGALKNQFGLLPYPDKRIFHRTLDRVIVDANLLFPCNFYLVDGISAMHGNGPLDGDSIELGILLSGKDPVAVDHCACTAVGIAPDSIFHVVLAEKHGLGSSTYDLQGKIPDTAGFTLPDTVH
jgi:uncharacterized protein (DUF362 family)